MNVTHKFTLDLVEKSKPIVVDVVQGDSARVLELSLLSQGIPWEIPEELAVSLRYVKADGTGGNYDTLPDGKRAWQAGGNVLSVGLAPQVCSVKGAVSFQITLLRGNAQISTFAFILQVSQEVTGTEESGDYTNLAEWLAEFGGEGGSGHVLNQDNPHRVTKTQVGLGQVDNTADQDKPVSIAVQGAINAISQDYIIEEGISNIWTYRKWASGVAECWGKTETTREPWGQQDAVGILGGVYTIQNASYPFAFIQKPVVTVNGSVGGTPYLILDSGDETRIAVDAYTNLSGEQEVTGSYYVQGLWKALSFPGTGIQDYVDAQLEVIENGAY